MLHPHSVFNYKTTPSQSTSHHYQHAVLTQSSSRQNTAVSLLHTTTSTLCSHSAFKQTKHSCQSTSHHYQHVSVPTFASSHRHVNPPTKHICALSSLRGSSEFFFQQVPVLHSLQQEARDLVVLSSAAEESGWLSSTPLPLWQCNKLQLTAHLRQHNILHAHSML